MSMPGALSIRRVVRCPGVATHYIGFNVNAGSGDSTWNCIPCKSSEDVDPCARQCAVEVHAHAKCSAVLGMCRVRRDPAIKFKR